VLFLVTFIDAAVHQSFFYWTASFLKTDVGIPANWVPPVMKIGQIAEILTMLILGYVLKSFGWRATMIVGVLGHGARFAVSRSTRTVGRGDRERTARHLLRVLLRHRLHLRGRVLPEGRAIERSGTLQRADSGHRPFVANLICGQLGTIYKVDGKLQYSSIFQYSMGPPSPGHHPGSILPPAERGREGTARRDARGAGPASSVRGCLVGWCRVFGGHGFLLW